MYSRQNILTELLRDAMDEVTHPHPDKIDLKAHEFQNVTGKRNARPVQQIKDTLKVSASDHNVNLRGLHFPAKQICTP